MEFNAEKTGLLPESIEQRGLGLIFDPLARNTPEELKILGELYKNMDRDNFPENWDSRSLGRVQYYTRSSSSASSLSADFYIVRIWKILHSSNSAKIVQLQYKIICSAVLCNISIIYSF